MSRTKKTEQQSKAQSATSGNVSAADPRAAVAFAANPGQETACSTQMEEQGCQECPSDEFNMAIRELAYYKWEAAGFPAGDGLNFWLEAEREINSRQQESIPASE